MSYEDGFQDERTEPETPEEQNAVADFMSQWPDDHELSDVEWFSFDNMPCPECGSTIQYNHLGYGGRCVECSNLNVFSSPEAALEYFGDDQDAIDYYVERFPEAAAQLGLAASAGLTGEKVETYEAGYEDGYKDGKRDASKVAVDNPNVSDIKPPGNEYTYQAMFHFIAPDDEAALRAVELMSAEYMQAFGNTWAEACEDAGVQADGFEFHALSNDTAAAEGRPDDGELFYY